MPSTSIAQQRLMGQAYALKTGELKSSDLDPKYREQIEDLAASMTEKDLKDFAETSHKGLPQKVKETHTMNKHIPTFESFINESIDIKYWSDYNDDAGVQGQSKHYSDKSTDFEDTFEDAVTEWNQEADSSENMIKGAQIQKIKKLAQEFFKKAGWISVNVVQAMIMQES